METPKGLQQAIKYFSDLDNCQQYMISVRWPDGVVRCPACKAEKVTYLAAQRRWKCYGKHARAQFSLKTGTIFEDSALGLDKWMTAVWLIANCKNGISSCEIARDLDITQKSAWHMAQRIRAAMKVGSFEKREGTYEIDESYFGGEAKNMHKHVRERKVTGTGGVNKIPVIGIGRRNENGKGLAEVTAQTVSSTDTATLVPIIARNIEFGSTVNTDCFSAYNPLGQVYNHQKINHSTEYVRGNVTTNRIENYWSVLKRGLKGTYIRANGQHLDRYIAEQSFRYNNRKETDAERFTKVIESIGGKRLTYKKLTGKR